MASGSRSITTTNYDDTPQGDRYIAATIWDPDRVAEKPAASARGQSGTSDIQIRPSFGPQDPGGPCKHPASITELDGGDLYLALAYPYLIQTRADRIHLVFTSNQRSVINLAVLDESAIAPNHGLPWAGC
jgi:hypothetical protein